MFLIWITGVLNSGRVTAPPTYIARVAKAIFSICQGLEAKDYLSQSKKQTAPLPITRPLVQAHYKRRSVP